MFTKERDEHQSVCPRCGAAADWSYADAQKQRVEILCANCGRYEMSREQFDDAMAGRAGVSER